MPSPDVVEDLTDTVAGIDDNNNGVRDDIEILITRSYDNPAIRDLALGFASAQRQYLQSNNKLQAEQRFSKVAENLYCLERLLAGDAQQFSHLVNTIIRWTANTEARFNALYEVERQMNGVQLTIAENHRCGV